MSNLDFTQFARYGVATVFDAAGRSGLVDTALVQVVPGSRAAGPARTVQCGQGDNLMVHAAIAQAQPGEVLVLSMPHPEPIALMGGLLAFQAKLRKVAAILIDGAARDTDELRELGLPVWARFIRARSPTKKIVGALNVPVTIGGTTISQGDIVVLDGDGAVVVVQERAAEVLEAACQRESQEADLKIRLEAGALTYDLHGLRAIVEGPEAK